MASSRPLGSLQQAILLLLWSDEYYGLEIQRRLRYQGKNVGPGQLYPALRKLESHEFITSREVQRVGADRIYYSITEKGKQTVVDNLLEVLFMMRYISIDYLNPYLAEAVKKTEIEPGSNILDLSSPVMEKIRMKTTELHKPDGQYLLVNTSPVFTDMLSEWVRSEQLEGVKVIDEKAVESLADESFDVVLSLFNITEFNINWTVDQAIRVLKVGGKLVVCDIAAREEDTIRDDLYKVYLPLHGKSGIEKDMDMQLAKRGMKALVYERERGMITGIFQKEM
jgi:DNA-binding PadR family transcriptional regulator